MTHVLELGWVEGGRSIVMNRVKRFTVCLAGHKWTKVAYPRSADGEATGMFLRCLRCGKEDHDTGAVARGAGGGF